MENSRESEEELSLSFLPSFFLPASSSCMYTSTSLFRLYDYGERVVSPTLHCKMHFLLAST